MYRQIEQAKSMEKNASQSKKCNQWKKNPQFTVYSITEEVGVGQNKGAASTFLADTLIRINHAMGPDEAGYRQVTNSFMLSADNAMAYTRTIPNKAYPTISHIRKWRGHQVQRQSEIYYRCSISGLLRKVQPANVPASDLIVPLYWEVPLLRNIPRHRYLVNTVDIGLAQTHTCIQIRQEV